MNESKGTMESVTLSRVPDEQRKNGGQWHDTGGNHDQHTLSYGRIHAGIQPINW